MIERRQASSKLQKIERDKKTVGDKLRKVVYLAMLLLHPDRPPHPDHPAVEPSPIEQSPDVASVAREGANIKARLDALGLVLTGLQREGHDITKHSTDFDLRDHVPSVQDLSDHAKGSGSPWQGKGFIIDAAKDAEYKRLRDKQLASFQFAAEEDAIVAWIPGEDYEVVLVLEQQDDGTTRIIPSNNEIGPITGYDITVRGPDDDGVDSMINYIVTAFTPDNAEMEALGRPTQEETDVAFEEYMSQFDEDDAEVNDTADTGQ